MIKKLFLTLFLSLSLVCNSFAQEKKRIFPERGIINFLGMDDTSSAPIIQDGRAADIQNIVLSLSGEAQRKNGYSYFTLLDTPEPGDNFEAVTSIYELYKSNGTRTKIASCGDKIFSFVSDTKTALSNPVITEGQDYQFVWITALDYAIGTNFQNKPLKTNGSIISFLSFSGLTNPITKAKCVIWWKNYLIFGNTVENSVDRTTRIRWSNVGTIETYSDDDFIDIATYGGQVIEGFGILRDELYVFLTDSIYKASLVGGNELLVITKVSDRIGAIAKNSIKNIELNRTEGLIFLSRDSTINFLDGVNIIEVSTLISDLMNDLKTSRLPYAVGVNDQFNGHYYLAVTDGTNPVITTTNNLLLDYFYSIGEWSKYSDVYANAIGIANDSDNVPQVYFGNYKSFIYQLNDSSLNSNVGGRIGTISTTYEKMIVDSDTASGLSILYDEDLSDYTTLLMHFEGINGSTVFVDEARNIITTNGNTQIDTAQYKIGAASGLFDGTADYLIIPDHDDWNFGTGNFTIETWFKTTTVSADQWIYYHGENPYETYVPVVYAWFNSDNRIYFQATNSGGTILARYSTGADVLSANTWYSIAFVRSGSNFYIFINGVSQSLTEYTAISTNSLPDVAANLYIGTTFSGGLSFAGMNGWFDEFRISKGIARWTANYTPSTSAYSNADIASKFLGGTIKIITGAGTNEERIICNTTSSGIVVTDSTTATGGSVYNVGDIDAYYVTKWYDCGDPSIRKNFTDLFLWTAKQATVTMELAYATDENSSIQTKTLSDYTNNSLWGVTIESADKTATGTTVSSTQTWAGEDLSFTKVPLDVSGRFIKLKFSEDDIDKQMNLVGYSLVYEPLDVY